nr:hypothetical protein [Tanacetum cinerariifolium]
MVLTFADTHNMITFLTKSDAGEGFEQIIDFLNACIIQYALTVNPTIYVSCIKQFWSSISLKKTNDVVRLQALIDRRKVIITEDMVRQALRLDNAKSVDCLPNEEIFAELARMGYEKPSTKLTFYKAFFLAQWKFLIHTILQCISAKKTTWNEFSSSMASVVICLPTEDEDAAKSTSPTPATTPPPPQELIPSTSHVAPTPPPSPRQSPIDKIAQALEITKQKQRVKKLEKQAKLKASRLTRLKKGRLEESQAQVYHLDLEDAQNVLSLQDDEAEPAELKEVIEVVTTAKLMTEVFTVAAATTIIAALSAARRRKGVFIRDYEETATPSVIVHSKPKSKDKGKEILVEEPKPLKKQAQIEQDKAYAKELEAGLNANIN